jgi:TetR/AcrR family transcriptional regulator, transcriptional repressor for nem operon
MLAVEQDTLPPAVEQAVHQLFTDVEVWLTRVLTEGRKRRQFRFEGAPEVAARSLFSAIEGALLTARSFRDLGRFQACTQWILQTVMA